ncbi:MAG: hypothetical protein SFV81_04070 [Pirellulaceae bacterium]|nr:hypothetical protein [Pirellulaceae bacterium]
MIQLLRSHRLACSLTVVPVLLMVFTCSYCTAQNNSTAPSPITPTSEADEWAFIDNGQIKVGVKRASGAAIGWMSLSGSEKNLVNHFDRGRLIQQSYYGNADGSLWDKQPWNWNPVQGGHYKGQGAPVIELKVDQQTLYAKSTPLHWATGEVLNDCAMEQTIKLTEAIAQVHYRFTYSGQETHALRDQEIPAVFLEPEYKHLLLYSGEQPWGRGTTDGKLDPKIERTLPGWPNETRKITEHWAAYVDDAGFGLGAYVPVANDLTCYRFGDGKREHGSCSYFAPLTRFAIKPGFVWEYDVYLTVGRDEEIRQRFQQLAK